MKEIDILNVNPRDFDGEAMTTPNLNCKKECPICYQIMVEPVIFECKHRFCLGCIKQLKDAQKNRCPLCRSNIQIKDQSR